MAHSPVTFELCSQKSILNRIPFSKTPKSEDVANSGVFGGYKGPVNSCLSVMYSKGNLR